MREFAAPVVAESSLRLGAGAIDYVLVALYFVVVLGLGVAARRSVSTSLDFLLSGRALPAWITGLAFMAANLGALELLGQSANGAQYGEQAVHYYWIGAIPAMIFLGLVMMPFYYGSKVRSVPEFLRLRFNATTQRLNAVLFAIASVLLAGVNLYAMAIVVNALLGWPTWVAVVASGLIVLAYTFLGGLSAAIYNEVLQFFVIVAALVPLTILGLHRVGGWSGLVSRMAAQSQTGGELHPFPAHELTGIANSAGSMIGVVLGLGFVTSFGYWTTNFAEVQRAFSAKDASAAQRTPLIAAIPKALFALIIVVPGMIAAVLTPQLARLKQGLPSDVTYNDAIPLLLRELLPNGMLGVALAGLLASFMAGMAANISAFNTVVTYDLWQDWIRPAAPDRYYLRVGRVVTVVGTGTAIGTAFIAAGFSNIMTYIQTLFSFFNVPLFAVFILGLFWKRMTGPAGWAGLVAGTVASVSVFVLNETGVFSFSGQGSSYVGGGAAMVLATLVAVTVSYATVPTPHAQLVGLVHSLTPRQQRRIPPSGTWLGSPRMLALTAGVLTVAGYIVFSLY